MIELVELDEKRDERAKKLSGGQRRRLDLALALVGDPDLIFLDEPTTGFDPAARRQRVVDDPLAVRARQDVFLTTHYMDEAQQLADRVAVMAGGEIIAIGRPDELGGRDLRPAEIRFALPAGWSLGDVPEVPATERSLDGDRVLVLTRRAAWRPRSRSPPGRSSTTSSSGTSRSPSRRSRTSTSS